MQKTKQMKKDFEEISLGTLLNDFLYFYGHEFDYIEQYIHPGSPYDDSVELNYLG